MERSEKERELDKSEADKPQAANDSETLDDAARGIGLRRVSAYVPSNERETTEQVRRREQRERMRRQRADASSQGFRQVNIPKVPVELVERVRAAVDEVLQGKAIAPQELPSQCSGATGVPRSQVIWLTGTATLAGFVIGMSVALIW